MVWQQEEKGHNLDTWIVDESMINDLFVQESKDAVYSDYRRCYGAL